MSRLNPARRAAVQCLVAVEGGTHADEALARFAPTAPRDRALSWHLVLGVLRRQGTLDHLLAPRLKRGMEGLQPVVRAALRMGLYELRLSRTQQHAAVDQAVEACRREGAARATGLVNAVLRRLDKVPIPDDPYLDLPDWLAERWRPYPEWVARLAHPSPVCGVLRDPNAGISAQDHVVPEGSQLLPSPAPNGCFRLASAQGAIDTLPGFKSGAWWVMDPASVAIADLCWKATPETRPRVLDACAAPGGKSFRLTSLGADVTAVDLHEKRLQLLSEGAARLDMNLPSLCHDWLTGPAPELGTDADGFDAVLVDAPCTGLGTIRRRPEVRWRRMASDPAAMGLRQRRILAAAAQHVKPGGVLVYGVCSSEPEEGEVIARGLAGWTVVETWNNVPPPGDEDAFQGFVLHRV